MWVYVHRHNPTPRSDRAAVTGVEKQKLGTNGQGQVIFSARRAMPIVV